MIIQTSILLEHKEYELLRKLASDKNITQSEVVSKLLKGEI